MLDSKRGRGGWTVSGAGECNLAGKARLASRLVGGSVSIAWQWLGKLGKLCKLLRNNFVTSRLNVTCVVRLL